jgi:hypothetical protein
MACNVTLGGPSVRIITTDILQIANGSHCLALSPLWERPPEECVCIQRMSLVSALGQKRTSAHARVKSALPPSSLRVIGMSALCHKQTFIGSRR